MMLDDEWGNTGGLNLLARYERLPVEWVRSTGQGRDGQYSVDAALASVRSALPGLHAVLLDISFGSEGEPLGIGILESLRNELPTLPILIFTSLDSAENRRTVVKCMELGANEFVEKAPTAEVMSSLLSEYLHAREATIYGNGPAVRALRARIARVAMSGEVPVLILGESGTGKELVARSLHRQGARRAGAFVAKNCAHADSALLDSELFGHERGAFTGAFASHLGLLEEARAGVLLMDEVSDMPMALQAKLLRAIESKVFRRLGGASDLHADFQLFCAMNRDPEEMLRGGQLREDFYYRIAGVTIEVPALRDRTEDIALLAGRFIELYNRRHREAAAVTPGAIAALKEHSWPGNVRELRSCIERAFLLDDDGCVDDSDMRTAIGGLQRGGRGDDSFRAGGASAGSNGRVSEPAHRRILQELELAVAVKAAVQHVKGDRWKAEFMRRLYPQYRAASAKGFSDVVRRLRAGPFADATLAQNARFQALLATLDSPDPRP